MASEGERLKELEAEVAGHETQEAALRTALTSSEARIAELEQILGPGVEETMSSLRCAPPYTDATAWTGWKGDVCVYKR